MFADFQNYFTFGFSRKFAIKLLSHFHHTITMLLHYLVKLKMRLLSFYHYSLHRNSFSFLRDVIHIIWRILPCDSTVTACNVRDMLWVLYLPCSERMCQLNKCAQPPCQCLPLQTSEMGDTHVYFIRTTAPTLRPEPNELQNFHKNSAAGLSQKNS